MSKLCVTCHQDKDETEFNKRASDPSGLQPRCRHCQASEYAKNAARIRPQIKARRDRIRRENKARVLKYLLSHPCVDCGETDPIVLEFDHVNGDKKKNVSELVNGSYEWVMILAEIAKCEVRCANCHRRVTYKRRQESNGVPIRHSQHTDHGTGR